MYPCWLVYYLDSHRKYFPKEKAFAIYESRKTQSKKDRARPGITNYSADLFPITLNCSCLLSVSGIDIPTSL